MSSFGAKRKARIIKVVDDDAANNDESSAPEEASSTDDVPKPIFSSKSGKKSFRQSGLRKTLDVADRDETSGENGSSKPEEDDDDGPVVVRPNASRLSSTKQKKRPQKSSRLSFGGEPGDTSAGNADDVATPKKVPFGQRVLENSALKKGISSRGLPLRSLQEDDDRPRYSKEYLEELQSSTPNTPQNVSSLPSEMGDEMELDPSELGGALVVESSGASPLPKPQTAILTEAEIREKKERRARLAKEENFLSVEDDEDEDSMGQRKKKDDTRLVAEDEDLGEGFDDYVDDGGLSLGKRAEKERRKRERQQMAEMINAAEGNSSDSSADSDAERRIAYESAQTRAGMDGMKKPRKNPAEDLLHVPPKITPVPSLVECLSTLQATLKGMEQDMHARSFKVQQLKLEKEEIVKREGEVQALLDEAGRKYQEAMGQGESKAPAISSNGPAIDLVGARGLESLGATPGTSTNHFEET